MMSGAGILTNGKGTRSVILQYVIILFLSILLKYIVLAAESLASR